MDYKHFIFTRYNLGIYDKKEIKTASGATVSVEDWMEYRLFLFSSTSRSLTLQNNPNFIWIVGIDKQTPVEDRAFIRGFVDIKVVFCESEIKEFFLSKILPTVKQPYIITTRLDNDDRLRRTVIQTIQENFRKKTEILDLYGRQLDEDTNQEFETNRTRPNSPFLSLVEPNSPDAKTCFHCNHTNMVDHFPSRFIGDENQYYYLQIIHDHCSMNKVSGIKINGDG